MSDTEKTNATTSQSPGRGISYPYIDLRASVAKAKEFHVKERKAAAPVVAAMKHFGFGEKSGGGRQTVSALIQFGLLEDEGIKDKRVVRLTDRALTILLAEPDSPDHISALKEAAKSPKIYSELLAKWPDGLPSDTTISYYLQKEKDFNPKTLQSFISDFRASLAFAKITESDTIALNKTPDATLKVDAPPPTFKVGDYVQWESGGVIQFTAPRQVTGLSDDGQFVFVAGSDSGIAIKEVSMMQAPAATPMQPSAVLPTQALPPIRVSAGARQDTFSLAEGNVVLQWPDNMSAKSFSYFEAWLQLQLLKIKPDIN